MRKKAIYLFLAFFCLVVLTSCSKSGIGNSKTANNNMRDFLLEYCDIYVNKFQEKDLESYGIELTIDMGGGYYKTENDCVVEMLKIDNESEKACKQYGESIGQDCDKARQARKNNYKKRMTKNGCIENGKNNRCAMFDTAQSQWSGVSSMQIKDANMRYVECLQKVEDTCSNLPKNW